MIKRYTRKTTIIEAIQWTGDNLEECIGFSTHGAVIIQGKLCVLLPPEDPYYIGYTLEEGDYLCREGAWTYTAGQDLFLRTFADI